MEKLKKNFDLIYYFYLILIKEVFKVQIINSVAGFNSSAKDHVTLTLVN